MRKLLLPLLIVVLIGGGAWFLFGKDLVANMIASAATATPPAVEPNATEQMGFVADASVLPVADVSLSFEQS